MSPFRIAHAVAGDWAHAVKACTDRLGDCSGEPALGFVYVTDSLAEDLSSILTYLRQKSGLEHWVGTVGLGVFAEGTEYFDEPAMAAMVAPLPENTFRLFPSLTEGAKQLSPDLRDWISGTSPSIGIVHADPSREDLAGLIDDVAQATSGFLVGGLTSSRAANHQVSGRVTGGGVSGVLLAPEIPVVTGLSQGCSPIGESHEISDCLDNVLIGLDGRKALDVFRRELGPQFSASLSEVGGLIHAALPIHGSDTGDYLVRSLVGIDPARGWLAIADQIEPGDRILFVKRDAETAIEDLRQMAGRLKSRIDGTPRGGVYISCIARGPDMFGDAGGEMAIIREALGDFPLLGFYANGEISFNRLYSYTGVLTLFL